MKNCRPLQVVLAGTLLVVCVAASAQRSEDRVINRTAADGTQVTIVSGQPHDPSYGPKPQFEQLDRNHDGIIVRDEAEAFLPLYNDYDDLVHHVPGITKRMYARWDYR